MAYGFNDDKTKTEIRTVTDKKISLVSSIGSLAAGAVTTASVKISSDESETVLGRGDMVFDGQNGSTHYPLPYSVGYWSQSGNNKVATVTIGNPYSVNMTNVNYSGRVIVYQE